MCTCTCRTHTHVRARIYYSSPRHDRLSHHFYFHIATNSSHHSATLSRDPAISLRFDSRIKARKDRKKGTCARVGSSREGKKGDNDSLRARALAMRERARESAESWARDTFVVFFSSLPGRRDAFRMREATAAGLFATPDDDRSWRRGEVARLRTRCCDSPHG